MYQSSKTKAVIWMEPTRMKLCAERGLGVCARAALSIITDYYGEEEYDNVDLGLS